MAHTLTFKIVHDYSAADAITVPVTLRRSSAAVDFHAYVDTGSTFCIFQRAHGEMLGLDVEAGSVLHVSTVTGEFTAYGHPLTLETLGYSLDVTVYFAAHYSFTRDVLGRHGWLDQVRIGIIEYEGHLYVSRYDEE